jgi:hypothetical protein
MCSSSGMPFFAIRTLISALSEENSIFCFFALLIAERRTSESRAVFNFKKGEWHNYSNLVMSLHFRFFLHALICLSLILREMIVSQPNPGSHLATRRVNTASMRNLSNKLSEVFTKIRCNVLKAGIKCDSPGLQQRWEELSNKVYTTRGLIHLFE